MGFLTFLVAVGLSLIFGVLGVINFAHGSFYMYGAFITFHLVASDLLPGGFFAAILLSAILIGILGGLIEFIVIRRIYEHEHIFQLLLTFALVLVLDNIARIAWGTEPRSVPVPDVLSFSVNIFGSPYPAYNIFIIVCGFSIAILTWYVMEHSAWGKLVLASSENREVASSLGVNVPQLFTIVFIAGSVLAGFGGSLAAPFTSVRPSMGLEIIIDAFIVVIVGGFGSLKGTFVASLLLGILGALFFITVPSVQPIVPFILLVSIIILRPTGLFGEEALT